MGSGSRCAPFLRRLSLPCGQPASASHRLSVRAAAHAPYLRRFSFPSVSAELISGRFPSSPLRASNPSGRQGRAVRSPGPARLRSSALHFADSASAGSGRTRFVPAPSLRRPQPTFASFRSLQEPVPVPLRSAETDSFRSLPTAPLPFREPACVTHRLRRLRQSSTPADSLPVRSASAVLAAPAQASVCSVPLQGYSLRGLRQNPFRAHSAPPARTGAGSLRFRLRATCPFTPAGSWRSAGYTASPRRPLLGQIALPARFPPRSDQPACPLPSSSGAPQAAQPSCGVRSRAD